MFLGPDKLDAAQKKTILTSCRTTDTLIIHYGANFQPTFTNNKGEALGQSYKIESVGFENAVGNKLNAWMISPDSAYNGITILFLHGNAGNVTSQFMGMLPFVKRGFKALVVDYSGFGFSEGKATRKNVLLDGNAAIEYMAKTKDPARKKLVIYGQSLGGHLSAVVAASHQDKIDGLVIEGAFSSHKDVAATVAGFIGRIFVAEKYSALKAIGNYNKPLLLIHSIEDETIPFKLGQKLYAKANAPKSFYQIDKCHICGPAYYPDSIATRIKGMLGDF